ncbi:hypothetical protein ABIC51_001976 [Burkholderia sp. 572]
MARLLVGAAALAILALVVFLRELKRGIDHINADEHHLH